MAGGQRVLVVDGLSETEQVLRAVLEPRGLQVERIRGHERLPPDEQAAPPGLLVLHQDEPAAQPNGIALRWSRVPRVVIGSMSLPVSAEDPAAHYLEKPFHYRELIEAVERLLADPDDSATADAPRTGWRAA